MDVVYPCQVEADGCRVKQRLEPAPGVGNSHYPVTDEEAALQDPIHCLASRYGMGSAADVYLFVARLSANTKV
jgi:hypothetical protein